MFILAGGVLGVGYRVKKKMDAPRDEGINSDPLGTMMYYANAVSNYMSNATGGGQTTTHDSGRYDLRTYTM